MRKTKLVSGSQISDYTWRRFNDRKNVAQETREAVIAFLILHPSGFIVGLLSATCHRSNGSVAHSFAHAYRGTLHPIARPAHRTGWRSSRGWHLYIPRQPVS